MALERPKKWVSNASQGFIEMGVFALKIPFSILFTVLNALALTVGMVAGGIGALIGLFIPGVKPMELGKTFMEATFKAFAWVGTGSLLLLGLIVLATLGSVGALLGLLTSPFSLTQSQKQVSQSTEDSLAKNLEHLSTSLCRLVLPKSVLSPSDGVITGIPEWVDSFLAEPVKVIFENERIQAAKKENIKGIDKILISSLGKGHAIASNTLNELIGLVSPHKETIHSKGHDHSPVSSHSTTTPSSSRNLQ